jgi:hypothetical protein
MQPKLDALDTDLRSFLLNYQAGQRTVTGLISKESMKTRSQISSGVSRLESSVNMNTAEIRHSAKDIKRHVSETVGATMATFNKSLHDLRLDEKQQEHRDRLLKCLKYPGMNERRQQITESFPQTFRWAFGEETFMEDEFGENEFSEDGDSNDGSGKASNPESNELPALSRYQVILDSGVYYTPWDSFSDWLRSDSPVYWISRKPGSGKTTLVKYFLSDARTKLALDVWKSGAFLPSHFFWRPGSPMQQNIKGLLCSLLYQLLEANDALTEYIASHFNDVIRKDTYTDWAIIELKQVCVQTLRNFGRPLCIFVDGLDEVDQRDGIFELFEVVDMIRQTPSTKLCLSSRPEPAIVKRLGRYPQLRIQDLTRGDLWTYAEGRLQFPTLYLADQYEYARHEIIRELVEKAEGVFLWLCLAVKSLNAGLDNEDHLEEVSLRAGRLPPDLARLYMDMWTRFNEDHAVYRQSAALYLKLVIASLRIPWYEGKARPLFLTQSNLTVLEMAIATASPEFRPELSIPNAEKLVESCNDTIRLVQTRCAGLLEVIVQSKPILSVTEQPLRHGFSKVTPFGNGSQTIRFIHRTAFDFLTDTAEGGTILSADGTSEQSLYMKLFRGSLSATYLIQDLEPEESPGLETYTHELSEIWHMAGPCQNSALDAQLHEITTFLELSASLGQLPIHWYRNNKTEFLRKDEFLVYAALLSLSKYVLAALVKREICDQLKSDILLAISARIARNLETSQEDIALLEELIHRGVDPNYNNCIFNFAWDTWDTSYQLIASPFCEFVAGIITTNSHSATKLNIQRVCHAMDGFLRHGADTSDLVNVNLCVLDSGEVEFVSDIDEALRGKEDIGEEEDEEEDKEEGATPKLCSLLVPAFILIDAFACQLEETLCKTGYLQEKCCNLDHIAAIRAKAKPIDTSAKPRIIALVNGNVYCRAVSDEDSVYLSDAVIKNLTYPRPQDATVMLRGRYMEVYRRSERRSSFKALLDDEGLLWDFSAHKHRLDEECTCTL